MIKKLLNTKISKENKKGFTLAELLIVVAIIGVLVAISIPIFTTQLEKSREATDISNIRSAYAEVVAAGLTDPGNSHSADIPLKQAVNGWATGSSTSIAGVALTNISATAGGTATVTWHPAAGSTDAYVTINSTTATINYGVQ